MAPARWVNRRDQQLTKWDDQRRQINVESGKSMTSGSGERVLVAGDTHGMTAHVDYLIRTAVRESASRVFVVGDFGYWEHEPDGVRYLDKVERLASAAQVEVAFCDGNHDNLAVLRERYSDRDGDGLVVVRPHVRYAPRGHRFTWGRTRFLAAGGAASLDKGARLEREQRRAAKAARKASYRPADQQKPVRDFMGTLWFPGEELTDDETEAIVQDQSPVDVMLCHDKPRTAAPSFDRKDYPGAWANQDRLQRIVDVLQPARVVHGHLHYRYTQTLANGTVVDGLACDPAAGATVPGYRVADSWTVLEA